MHNRQRSNKRPRANRRRGRNARIRMNHTRRPPRGRRRVHPPRPGQRCQHPPPLDHVANGHDPVAPRQPRHVRQRPQVRRCRKWVWEPKLERSQRGARIVIQESGQRPRPARQSRGLSHHHRMPPASDQDQSAHPRGRPRPRSVRPAHPDARGGRRRRWTAVGVAHPMFIDQNHDADGSNGPLQTNSRPADLVRARAAGGEGFPKAGRALSECRISRLTRGPRPATLTPSNRNPPNWHLPDACLSRARRFGPADGH